MFRLGGGKTIQFITLSLVHRLYLRSVFQHRNVNYRPAERRSWTGRAISFPGRQFPPCIVYGPRWCVFCPKAESQKKSGSRTLYQTDSTVRLWLNRNGLNSESFDFLQMADTAAAIWATLPIDSPFNSASRPAPNF